MTTRGRLLLLSTLLPLALAGAAFAQGYVLPSGAISWWRAEEGALDVVGTNHGTLESGVTSSLPGKVGLAFSFNGLPDGGGIDLRNVPAFDFAPSSSFTMEAWIHSAGPTVAPSDGQTILILNYGCRPDAPTNQMLILTAAGEKAAFYVTDMNGRSSAAISPEAPSKNAWHHVAGVREVTGSGKTLKVYVDGVLVATEADATTGALALNTPDFIGRRTRCGTQNTFKGLIDEPAVYNRALSAEEITEIFRAGSAGKIRSAPPKLISGAVTTFQEDQPGVPVDPAIQIDDDERRISWAIVTITDVRDTGREILAADTAGTEIAATWNAPHLTLVGEDTLENYEKVLRSVAYRNESQAPDDSAQRHVEFVVRDRESDSNRVTRLVDVVSINDPPVAGDDRFTMVGNTLLEVGMDQGGVAVRTSANGKGVLDNDADPAERETVRVVGVVGCADAEAPFSCRTANGNGIELQESGAFAVIPDNAGDPSPSDSFQYEVSDGTDAVTATVTIERTGRVWYVRNDYAGPGPAGTSTRPFRTLAEAEAASAPGDTIYVFEGTLSAGIELKAEQRLIGAGEDLRMPYGSGTVELRAGVATPRLQNPAGAAVSAAAIPAEIAGLILEGSTDGVRISAGGGIGSVRLHDVEIRANGGTGLRVTGGGSGPLDVGVTVAGAAIFAQDGPAVDVEGAAIDIDLVRLESLGSSSAGISLIDAHGRFSAGGGSRIEGSAGDAVHLAGGRGDLSFGGRISGGPSGHSVHVSNRASGSASFSGPIADNGKGIRLDNGGTIAFSGGLTLRPAAGFSGFVAEGGGTVTVTGAANTAAALGGGQALVVRNTEIGAAGLTFLSLSASGAAGGSAEAGIHLENTGVAGGLTVTGSGAAGSGGTLQGLGGAGIALAGTAGVSLSYLDVQGNGGDGIQGAGVTGLNLTGCRILDNGDAATDHGLDFDNLSGSVAITGTEIIRSGHHDVRIANTEGVLDSLSVSGSRFVEPRGGYALALEAHGTASVNAVILSGSTFAGSPLSLRLASSGSGKISGLQTATSTFTGGASLELAESQIAALTCSP